MSFIKTSIKPLVIKVYRLQAALKLPKVYRIGSTSASKVARAIDDALKNNIDTVEMEWVNKIESKRDELNNSAEEILITDFGAGTPDLNRTTSEMYEGVNTTTTIGKTCKLASKPYFWSLLLFKLIREFKPSLCLEFGTCLGISGAYQAAALKINHVGKLITLEGSESLAAIADRNFQQLGLDNAEVVSGRFQVNLDRILVENSPIDYAFIDGHHDEKATINYFEKLLPCLSDTAILIFDDISWSEGMRRAWKYIEKEKRVSICLNLGVVGICIVDASSKDNIRLNIPML